jgi:LysM repeat protein
VSKDKTYYTVVQGDNLQNLALKFYGDYDKATLIMQANGVTNKSFENQSLVGQSILVPLLDSSVSPILKNNLVYYRRLKIATPQERQLQILGGDLNLDNNRQIQADGSGDLLMLFGQDCYLANITDRLKFQTGTLMPIHPEWGINLEIGNVPANIFTSRAANNIDGQINLDPRTKTGYVDRENLDLQADTLKVPVFLKSYSGSENTIDIGSLLPV